MMNFTDWRLWIFKRCYLDLLLWNDLPKGLKWFFFFFFKKFLELLTDYFIQFNSFIFYFFLLCRTFVLSRNYIFTKKIKYGSKRISKLHFFNFAFLNFFIFFFTNNIYSKISIYYSILIFKNIAIAILILN